MKRLRQFLANPRRAAAAGSAFLVLLGCSPFLWGCGRDVRYRWQVNAALDGEIAYVEFQPNFDWPKRRLTDPEKIKALHSWLLATEEDSWLRSAPPGCFYQLRFVFRDGREEVIPISAMSAYRRHPLDEPSDVRSSYKGHMRTGSAKELADIMGAN